MEFLSASALYPSPSQPLSSPAIHTTPPSASPLLSSESSLVAFYKSSVLYPYSPCLSTRAVGGDEVAGPYVPISYAKVAEMVLALAAWMSEIGHGDVDRLLHHHRPDASYAGQRNVVTILPNSPNFTIASYASSGTGMSIVPVYTTSDEPAIRHIVVEVNPIIVFVHCDLVDKLKDASGSITMFRDNPKVRVVVVGSSSGSKRGMRSASSTAAMFALLRRAIFSPPLTWPSVISAGARIVKERNLSFPSLLRSPNPSAIHTICYTSGTTQKSKGCVLTNNNISNVLKSIAQHLELDLGPGVVHFSYLPVSHIFERVVQEGIIGSGGEVRFIRFNKDHKTQTSYLLPDLVTASPTIFAAAPRVLDKIKDGVDGKVRNGGRLARFLYENGLRHKLAKLEEMSSAAEGIAAPAPTIYDGLIFDKIKKSLGLASCTMVISGSAPLAPSTYRWLRCILPNVNVVEGYGLTETAGGVSVTKPNSCIPGVVGGILPNVQVRIKKIPGVEKGGEIQVRGPNVFAGYWEKDGNIKRNNIDTWFETGDVGLFEKVSRTRSSRGLAAPRCGACAQFQRYNKKKKQKQQ